MKIRTLGMIAAALVLTIAAVGCVKPSNYGDRITDRSLTPIKNILADPKSYDGKTVTVKGKIILECETGCWFNLKEGDAVIYVNLEPSGFAIPQNVGRTATAQGTISVENGKPTLTAKGAEVQ